MRKNATLRDEKTLEVVENEREKVGKSIFEKNENRAKIGLKSSFFNKNSVYLRRKMSPGGSENRQNKGEFTFLQL